MTNIDKQIDNDNILFAWNIFDNLDVQICSFVFPKRTTKIMCLTEENNDDKQTDQIQTNTNQ